MTVGRRVRPAALAGALFAWPACAFAQTGPWAPLGSRLDRAVSWAVGAGALEGLNPLIRPWRRAAIAGAVAHTDTLRLPAAARTAWRRVAAELARTADTALVAGELVIAGYEHGGRDSFRPAGRGRVRPAGGLWASLTSGPVVAVFNPAFESRLYDDPEFTGETATEVAGRVQSAYLALSGARGDLLFGRLARQWGPDRFEGLQLSPSAYAMDGLAGAVRLGRFELTAVAMQLDADSIASGTAATPFNRYFFAHRLDIRLGRNVWLGLVESGVYGGRGKGWDPALHAPLNLAIVSSFNEDQYVNVLLGADLAAGLGRLGRIELSGYLDDVQTDDTALTDERPASYGATALWRWALPAAPVQLTLGYTRVAALSYRNSEPALAYLARGVGLARNASDYDQWRLLAEARPADRLDLGLEVHRLRQGAGDLHDPMPADSVLAQPGQGFLVAPVRTVTGVRLTAAWRPREGLELAGEVGTTGRVGAGAAAIASFAVRLGADLWHRRLGAAYPGVERGALRGWP